jgi:hypothetical protein
VAHRLFPLPEITYPLVIDTIGKHLATGHELVAYCDADGCHHSARVNLVRLGYKVGRDYQLNHDSLRPHFRCSRCEAAGRDPTQISFRLLPCTDPYSAVEARP